MTRPALFDGRSILVACLVSMVHIPVMRDPNRIPRILDLLKVMWRIAPDQRLGQVVDNYANPKQINMRLVEDDVIENQLMLFLGLFAGDHLQKNGFPDYYCTLTQEFQGLPADDPDYVLTYKKAGQPTRQRQFHEVPDLDDWLKYVPRP
jgi:hypothetical protein